MTILIYNLGIFFLKIGIYVSAIFNEKARQWVSGRKNIFEQIEQKLAEKSISKQYNSHTKTIWMHCASLGEFEQGRPVLESFGRQDVRTILTFFSPSGYEIRKNSDVADFIFYLPLDTPTNAKRFTEMIKPDLVFFVKYDFWGNYLSVLKQKNIPVFLIAAQFRKEQFSSFYGIYLKKILLCFTHFFAQTVETADILKSQGFNNVTVTGDTRVDRVLNIKSENVSLPAIEKFVQGKKTFIAGSTWKADEEIIFSLISEKIFQDWQFIIVPHDVSSQRILSLQTLFGTSAILYSDFEKYTGTEKIPRILIIDRIGLLSKTYRYGTVAYIGGGFGRGIHNILEPAVFGLPIIFGEKYQKFPEAVALVQNGGAFSVLDAEALKIYLTQLTDKAFYEKASKIILKFIEDNKGATELIQLQIKNQE